MEQNTQISMLPQFTTVLFSAFIQKLGSTSVVQRKWEPAAVTDPSRSSKSFKPQGET